jgi:hypothetical protein
MGAKHAELTTHRRGAPSPVALGKSLGPWIQQPLQIAVAKAVDGELATMNGPAATASWPGASVVLI